MNPNEYMEFLQSQNLAKKMDSISTNMNAATVIIFFKLISN